MLEIMLFFSHENFTARFLSPIAAEVSKNEFLLAVLVTCKINENKMLSRTHSMAINIMYMLS